MIYSTTKHHFIKKHLLGAQCSSLVPKFLALYALGSRMGAGSNSSNPASHNKINIKINKYLKKYLPFSQDYILLEPLKI